MKPEIKDEKLAYERPQVVDHGTVADLTLAGIGKNPGKADYMLSTGQGIPGSV